MPESLDPVIGIDAGSGHVRAIETYPAHRIIPGPAVEISVRVYKNFIVGAVTGAVIRAVEAYPADTAVPGITGQSAGGIGNLEIAIGTDITHRSRGAIQGNLPDAGVGIALKLGAVYLNRTGGTEIYPADSLRPGIFIS